MNNEREVSDVCLKSKKLELSKTKIVRPSCMLRLKKPWRWLMKKAYRLVHGGTPQDKCNPVDENCNNKLTPSLQLSPNSELSIVSIEDLQTDIPEDGLIPINSNSSVLGQCEDDRTIRQAIYDLIQAQDILSLRLTSSTLKKDIDSVHGISMKVHDGRFDYEKVLQMFGIRHLTIEQLINDNLNHASLLPRPELLKTLTISGSISGYNLESLLRVSPNLVEWAMHFQLSEQIIPTTNYLNTLCLNNLKILHISSTSPEVSMAPSVRKSIQDVLINALCPNLKVFLFFTIGLSETLLHEYHLHAHKFIRKNESLRKVDIELRQLGGITRASREDIMFANEWIDKGSTLLVFQLNINSKLHLWYPLLDSQTCLRSLNLQMMGQTWNRLILTLDRNARTLQSLVVSGLCSTSQDGITAVPIDLGLLRNLMALETLEIQQIDLESRGMESPTVLRTFNLPQTLKSVKLCHLRLKPHQAMFLLLKLPMLEILELECWSDSEETLAAYLSVVTFVIKFNLTSVKNMTLMDRRRRMENLRYAISKLRNNLPNETNIIFQTNTELYSKLAITRYV